VVKGKASWGGNMKVLVACEFSGIVREAFRKKGHNAWSCDFLPSEIPGPHLQGDVREVFNKGWDLMIAHPPCTYLALAGLRWAVGNPERQDKEDQALGFVLRLLGADVPKIALENPVGIITRHIRKWDQMIHPWQFGEPEEKKTCLWLKGLPLLEPTKIMSEREQKCFKMPPSSDRWKKRSRTYPGIALAMADQWG
jgi:hypothetical protein